MIAIVDYGAGNLNSVKKAFDYLEADVVVTDQSQVLTSADKIVLPGVGHFSTLRGLERTGLRRVLLQAASAGKPFLGICLGMQWLFDGSEECIEVAGSGIFSGKCRRFPSWVKSPHVGSPKIHLCTTRTLFMRRCLPQRVRRVNTDCSLLPPSSNSTFSDCSSIRRNQETWGLRS
jgi:imidazole glycerol phosphate synthase glutamine amidotransferase subunit